MTRKKANTKRRQKITEKTRFVLRQKPAMAAIILLGLVVSTVATLQVLADSPVIVEVTKENEASSGWVRTEAAGASLKYVYSDSGVGSGALELAMTTNESYVQLQNDSIHRQQVSSVYRLSYMTQKLSGDVSAGVANLYLHIDTTGDGKADDVLVYEPAYNAAVKDMTWQTWAITQSSGLWWSSNALTYSGNGGVTAGSIDSNFTLLDVIMEYPTAEVVGYGIGTGMDSSPRVVHTDAMTINDYVYNFEPASLATTKEQCKGDDWKKYGETYKNQGECVASVTKNQ